MPGFRRINLTGGPAAQPLLAPSPVNPRAAAMVAELMRNASSTAPVSSIGEGVARLGFGALAAWRLRQADARAKHEEGLTMERFRTALDFASGSPAGVDPRTGVDWETARAPNRGAAMAALLSDETLRPTAIQQMMADMLKEPEKETFGSPIQGLGPEGNPIFGQIGNQGTFRPVEGFTSRPAAARAPTSRTRNVNGQTITEEWIPAARQWREVSQAPRSASSINRDVIMPLIEKVLNGGTLTANEQRAFDLATRADPLKVLMRQALGEEIGGAATSPEEVAPAAARVPDGPDLLDRTYDDVLGFVRRNFGGGEPTPLPRTAGGKVDRTKLKDGETYRDKDGLVLRWNAKRGDFDELEAE